MILHVCFEHIPISVFVAYSLAPSAYREKTIENVDMIQGFLDFE